MASYSACVVGLSLAVSYSDRLSTYPTHYHLKDKATGLKTKSMSTDSLSAHEFGYGLPPYPVSSIKINFNKELK